MHQGDETTLPTLPVTGVTDTTASGVEEAPPEGAPLDPAGRYRRVETLGRSRGAHVYRVRDTLFKRTVAMKVLAWEHAQDPRERIRFLTEADIGARLQHPGVIPIHDRGVTVDGRPFFTMLQVRGRTFDEVLRRLHTSPKPDEKLLRKLLRAYLRVCATVAYAHHRDVVHGALRPQHIMLAQHGRVLVLGWGQARSPHASLSLSDELGLAYLAPELVAAKPAAPSPRQDIYALGAVLYALLAGCAPYQGDASSVLAQVHEGPPAPLSEMPDSPLRPAALCALSAKAMQRDPEARAIQARVLAAAVNAWL